MYCNEISKIDASINPFKDKINKFYSVIEDIKGLDKKLGDILLPKTGYTYGEERRYDKTYLFRSNMHTIGKIDGNFQVVYQIAITDKNILNMYTPQMQIWNEFQFTIKFYMSTQYARITEANFYCNTNKKMDYLSMHDSDLQLYQSMQNDIKNAANLSAPKSYKNIQDLSAFLIHIAENVDDFNKINLEFKKKRKLLEIKSINKEKFYG